MPVAVKLDRCVQETVQCLPGRGLYTKQSVLRLRAEVDFLECKPAADLIAEQCDKEIWKFELPNFLITHTF